MAQQDIRIPDIGGAEDVEVIEILVKPGSVIATNDPLIVIESDKASMEVPATVSGKLVKITVALGDKVQENQVIAVVEVDAATATPSKSTPAADPAPPTVADRQPLPQAPAPARAESATPRRFEVRVPDIGDAKDVVVVEVAVKVGQSVALDDLLVVVESDKASMEIPAPVAGRITSVDVSAGTPVNEGTLLVIVETADPVPVPEAAIEKKGEETVAMPAPQPQVEAEAPVETPPSGTVYAGPAVRRLARELGVDLTKVTGTGMRGRVQQDDVNAFVKKALSTPAAGRLGGGIPPIPTIDFARFGVVETLELSRIRTRGAENLHRSWLNVPHVTQHDEADVTDLEEFRSELKAEAQAKGVKLTPLAFIVKAVTAMLRVFPTFNASLDPALRHLIVKKYYHIGLAVDTPEGLIVPVLRDADQKGVFDLAKEIEALSQKALQGKLAVTDLQGASFTISSLGSIGGTGFTPIINAPEVAILGVSRLTMKPHWNGSTFEPRRMLPVSLSYDHRAINGAEAGRFVTQLCQTLSDMRRVLL
ncbi:MAG TPA: dihydrolipoyllysine-residue acetyltransferase [Pseudomonadales bacterium]